MSSRLKFTSAILTIFVIACALFFIGQAGVYVLSGLRAYVGGEGLWAKGQRDATYQLIQYIYTKEEIRYQSFLDALKVPLGDKAARIELIQPSPNDDIIIQGFVDGGNHPNDIPSMIFLFKKFKNLPYISDAIEQWEIGDRLIAELIKTGELTHRYITSNSMSKEKAASFLITIDTLHKKLNVAENLFSYNMSVAARWTATLLFFSMLIFTIVGSIICFIMFRMIAGIIIDLNVKNLKLIAQTERERSVREELKESEKKFRLLAENVTDIIWMTDMSFNPTYYSPSIFKLQGFTPEEAKARSIEESMTPESYALAMQVFTQALEEIDKQKRDPETPATMELELFCKDGSTIIAEVTANFIINSDGQLEGIIGVTRDISKRKKAEELVMESRAKLLQAQYISRTGDFTWDIASGAVTWSEGMHLLLKYDRSEKIDYAKVNAAIHHPDDLERVTQWLNDSISSGKKRIVPNEYRLVCRDGEILYVHTKGNIEYKDGKAVKLFGTCQDITERKKAELELIEQKKVAERYLNLAGVMFIGLDSEGNVNITNQKARDILGCSEEDIIGQNWFDNFIPQKIRNDVYSVFKQLIAGNAEPVEYYENPVVSKSGKEKLIAWHNTYIKNDYGKIIGILGSGEDITEKRELEKQVLQAQKMESVGRLAGGVAHDYNNALSVIIGFTEMAIDEVDPAGPVRADLDEIFKAAKRAEDITRQLLAFARKQIIAPTVLDLNENVEGMLKMLRRLIGEDIDLAWLPGAVLWPVKMDPSQIDQILANLCVNARDAIEGVGKITIETDTVVFNEAYCSDHTGFIPGEFVLLAVSDNGCGMDKEIVDKIFEPFFTTKAVDKGTGLGLATVYGIVKQNNGFVNVYSEPGKGTTIKIYLPRHEGKAVEIHGEITAEIPQGQGETVLLVEDDLSILKLAEKILEGLGYTVLTAGTPGEAMGLAKEHDGKIHLLLTDVIMPEMNGRELAQQLQSHYPGLKRVFMSGYTANAIAHHGVLDEGVNFIQKPFSKRDLAAIVRKALDE